MTGMFRLSATRMAAPAHCLSSESSTQSVPEQVQRRALSAVDGDPQMWGAGAGLTDPSVWTLCRRQACAWPQDCRRTVELSEFYGGVFYGGVVEDRHIRLRSGEVRLVVGAGKELVVP